MISFILSIFYRFLNNNSANINLVFCFVITSVKIWRKLHIFVLHKEVMFSPGFLCLLICLYCTHDQANRIVLLKK